MKPYKPRSPRARAVVEGYRSGLEETIADQLRALGIDGVYEERSFEYHTPPKASRYLPDFILPNGIVVESKGRFVTADRQKHLAIKACRPGLDIRFVFSNPKAKIGKKSKTSYADWCDHKGFKYATRLIPEEWINEPMCKFRQNAIELATYIPKRRT